jgi:hypothetical protein
VRTGRLFFVFEITTTEITMVINQPTNTPTTHQRAAPGSILAEPETFLKIWKDRRRTESVHVTVSEYQGRALISVRIYATGTDGIDRPTPKGVSMAVDKLPQLARALAKAEARARALGLLDDHGATEASGADT